MNIINNRDHTTEPCRTLVKFCYQFNFLLSIWTYMYCFRFTKKRFKYGYGTVIDTVINNRLHNDLTCQNV